MSVADDFLITTVAKVIESRNVVEDYEKDTTFLYRGEVYQKLIDWKDFNRIFRLSKNTGFYVKKREVNDAAYLILFYARKPVRQLSTAEFLQKRFIIDAFFEPAEENVPYDDDSILELTGSTNKELALDTFYEQLRQAHQKDDLDSGVPSEVQHQSLQPLLRPYQKKGIRWMLTRENRPDYLRSTFIKMRSKNLENQIFYYNKYSAEFSHNCPEPVIPIPSGGLLTDEMGLGKTVEMIGLMLMNPKPKRKAIVLNNDDEDSGISTMENEPLKKMIKIFNTIKCMCNKQNKRQDVKKLISCTNCWYQQHIKCVFQREITNEDRDCYMCPFCWKASERIIEAKTTIIVTPAAIKSQWQDEIKRHINDENFKVLIYEGINKCWVSPVELAKYDAVLTDFNILSQELYFAETISRELRHDKKFENPPSPLSSVLFWRVVLDEAQMVENKNTRPSQMVKHLPAVHRWGTTGTPIEKDSIRCLYGLIYFLDFYPYTDSKIFDELWNEYRSGKHENMIHVLSKIMWRTCKKNVAQEINIPAQKEIIHYVSMSDLQKMFYQQVHIITKPEFLKNVQDYLKRHKIYDKAKGEWVIDYSIMDQSLHELNNATMRMFLEPLRKLRQDCTIPNLFHQQSDQTRIKQTLRPEQLQDHLVSKTSIECKSALRTICSSLNGSAALKIAQDKKSEAILMYKQVLRLAKDYTGAVHVDSMLQIHAYHNLKEIDQSDEQLYAEEIGKLEWKFISNFYDKVKEINRQIDEQRQELTKAKSDFKDTDGFWFRDIICIQRTAEEEKRLMDIINLEVFSSIAVDSPQLLEQTRSTHGIQLILTEWMDKINRFTKDIKKRFAKFDFIIKHLRPLHEMTEEQQTAIAELAKIALNCHLNLFDEEDDDNIQPPKTLIGFCDLCKLKMKLNEYECILFNKALIDSRTRGSWNARFEEKLLRAILNYAKRSDFEDEIIETGQNFFKYLEALKNQFRLHSQLWVEANHTVSGFDELNMCKIRMQVVEPDEITEEDSRTHLKITKYEVEEQLHEFQVQKQEAELNFARLNGRLKYLEHLKAKNEPPTCPICTCIATERYYVTICGHTLCATCFLIMTKARRMQLACPVCRTTQAVSNVYAVTCDNSSSSEKPINGSYSPKINEIIRCILRLKDDEPDVKILIFSHWDSILLSIINGLKANNISYRASFVNNFTKQVNEFKDYSQNVTCMCLNLKFGGKGLNLIEATHVFLVEPILNADEELQAIGRVHRIGQTRETFVHRFITEKTIESTIYEKIIREKDKWIQKKFTIRDLEELFTVHMDDAEENTILF